MTRDASTSEHMSVLVPPWSFYYDVFNKDGIFESKVVMPITLDKNSVWKNGRIYTVEKDENGLPLSTRQRYRAEKILEFLYSLRTDKIDKIVGLTSSDISTTKDPYDDWGIFGMAFINGSTCVVSTFRLGEGKVDTVLFHERLKKVIAHEVGHILGLPHCPTPGCLMQDAQGRIATIDGSDGVFVPDVEDASGSRTRRVLKRPGTPSPL